MQMRLFKDAKYKPIICSFVDFPDTPVSKPPKQMRHVSRHLEVQNQFVNYS